MLSAKLTYLTKRGV